MSTFKNLNIKSNIQDYSVTLINNLSDSFMQNTKKDDFFIIDQNISRLYIKELKEIIAQRKYIIVEAIEPNKTLENVTKVIRQLLKLNFKKNHRLIALGGGIIQDITGFIASILYRGIPWVFYPTTLLSQSDSCIGSKTSINVDEYKNQLGTFYPPIEILLTTEFLKTLPLADIKSGLGEIIKVHLLDSSKSLDYINEFYDAALNNYEIMTEMICHSLLIKKDIIEIDEYDREYRNIMNYGHTFGHAIESVTNYSIPHGQAVTIGMDIANYISNRLGLISEEIYNKMKSVIIKNWPDFDLNLLEMNGFFNALRKDKKNIDTSITMILSNGPGKMIKKTVELDKKMKNILLSYFDNKKS